MWMWLWILSLWLLLLLLLLWLWLFLIEYSLRSLWIYIMCYFKYWFNEITHIMLSVIIDVIIMLTPLQHCICLLGLHSHELLLLKIHCINALWLCIPVCIDNYYFLHWSCTITNNKHYSYISHLVDSVLLFNCISISVRTWKKLVLISRSFLREFKYSNVL